MVEYITSLKQSFFKKKFKDICHFELSNKKVHHNHEFILHMNTPQNNMMDYNDTTKWNFLHMNLAY